MTQQALAEHGYSARSKQLRHTAQTDCLPAWHEHLLQPLLRQWKILQHVNTKNLLTLDVEGTYP